jgi:hypothetical protein
MAGGARLIWLVVALVTAAPLAAAEPFAVEPLLTLARRAGLRVIEARHLALVTDLAAHPGDGIDALPELFDAAFAAWCRHYGLDPAAHDQWRAFGCLVGDRDRFRVAGLLPTDGSVPDFVNGFCERNRFWLADQSNPAYRRHLLLHEGVHAFTLTIRRAAAPTWYTEGIAELLATHRLVNGRFEPTPIPSRAADVEQWGRIETLRRLREAGAQPALADVLALPPTAHQDIPAYASSWAAVALLSSHPAHARAFAAAERGPLDRDFNTRLAATPGFDAAAAARDFAAFLDDLDYGYDPSRMAVDWTAGTPLAGSRTVPVAADRGWQNAGVVLEAGRSYQWRATGRCRLGTVGRTTLESEPDGISYDWYRDRPIGRLLVAQWHADGGGPPGFRIVAAGAAGDFRALADGPVFLRINEPPSGRADNAAGYTVDIAPRRRPAATPAAE